MNFKQKIDRAVSANDSLVCVGLDPDRDKMPKSVSSFFEFNKAIIDATKDLVCSYKPNSAFYEATGPQGIEQLKSTTDYIKQVAPEIPVCLDFKRGDIGNTNKGYISYAFDYLNVDAVTVHPYMGKESLQPYLDIKDKGVIILCRTSNPGAGVFQDLKVNGKKLYQLLAESVRDDWNQNQNCALVIGATFPSELAEVRKIVGNEMLLLVPGIGAQGGDIEKTMKAGLNSAGQGIIVNSSRGIIHASNGPDFAEAARASTINLRDEINKHR